MPPLGIGSRRLSRRGGRRRHMRRGPADGSFPRDRSRSPKGLLLDGSDCGTSRSPLRSPRESLVSRSPVGTCRPHSYGAEAAQAGNRQCGGNIVPEISGRATPRGPRSSQVRIPGPMRRGDEFDPVRRPGGSVVVRFVMHEPHRLAVGDAMEKGITAIVTALRAERDRRSGGGVLVVQVSDHLHRELPRVAAVGVDPPRAGRFPRREEKEMRVPWGDQYGGKSSRGSKVSRPPRSRDPPPPECSRRGDRGARRRRRRSPPNAAGHSRSWCRSRPTSWCPRSPPARGRGSPARATPLRSRSPPAAWRRGGR